MKTALAFLLVAAPAQAATHIIGAGELRSLSADLVLADGDVLEAGAAGGARCTIEGNGHSIRTEEGWRGRIAIRACDLRGVGTAETPALEVSGDGEAEVTVEDTNWQRCGQIRTLAARVIFRGNTIGESTLVPTVVALGESAPVFHAEGAARAGSVFQGNLILRSWAHFQQTADWLIGGGDGDGNIIVGNRAGVSLEECDRMVVRGNYLHSTGPFRDWNQVKNFNASGTDLLVEHNVIRGGNWLVDFQGGELRYNLLLDSFDRPWIITSTDGRARIHHNILLRTTENHSFGLDGLWVLSPGTPSTEVYNNTFDGGGACQPQSSGAVAIEKEAVLASLRSNAFLRFRADKATALVRGHRDEMGQPEPGADGSAMPPRLGYADFNLFDNSRTGDNYAVGVPGKQERIDRGFAAGDATPGGAKDEQVASRIGGPLPAVFAFADADLTARRVSVCRVLRSYRQLYTPQADSLLIDRGDPADGPGNDIGAVGAGAPHEGDRFATLCPGDDPPLSLGPEAFKCMAPPDPPRPEGETPGPGGAVFVCQASRAPASSAAVALALAALVLLRLRRRRPLAIVALVLGVGTARAAPEPPGGPHPRLFLRPPVVAALKANAARRGTAAAAAVDLCKRLTADPRAIAQSGYQGDAWAYGASACALSYRLGGDPQHARTGVRLWRALLEDVERLGDGEACVAGASPERATASIRRDTGYAIRFVGPHAALAYDWLHDAPGVTEALRAQSRSCFRAWIDHYTSDGYLSTQPGANYHAGFVAAKTLIAIAEAGEDRASDRFWREVVDDVFGRQIVENGLGAPSGPGRGALLGGDWPEGWQYGPLSVLEYAFSARALGEQGVSLPGLRDWARDLTLVAMHGTIPGGGGTYPGGDTSFEGPLLPPSSWPLAATLLLADDEAAGWAASLRRATTPGETVFDALAEARPAVARDPRATLAPWYFARGTRNLYARARWRDDSPWAVFTSAPRLVDDHQHVDASSFVFARGADPLIVDPSPYGSRSTLTGNAVTVEAASVVGDYRPSQTPWSAAEMRFVRGTRSGVVAARADFAEAFRFAENPSTVPLAQRDFVFLPEGELVLIDRVDSGARDRKTHLRFRSPATLVAHDGVIRGNTGPSTLVIHPLIAPAAQLRRLQPGPECAKPFGACDDVRFPVGEYALALPGPRALAVHVLDGLARGEPEAEADAFGGEDEAVIGASVKRAGQQSYVLRASAGQSVGLYTVPGRGPARHVVFDASADAEGLAAVSARAVAGRCEVRLSAEGPARIPARPAVFFVSDAAHHCVVTPDPDRPSPR